MKRVSSFLVLASLYFTVTSVVPFSVISSAFGWFMFLTRVIVKPRFYTFEIALIIFIFYFLFSAFLFDPTSFFYFGFYRYDGNFIVSVAPVFALAFLKSNISIRSVFNFVVFTVVLHSVLVFLWLLFKPRFLGGGWSFSGLYGARNAIGGFLSIISVILLVGFFNVKDFFKEVKVKRNLMLFMLLLVFLFMVLTYSRGSLIAFFLVFFIYFLFIKFKVNFDILFLCLLFLSSLSIAIYFYDPVESYSSQDVVVSNYEEDAESTKSKNVLIRVTYLWPKAISMLLDSPVFGEGVGSFNEYNGFRAKIDINDRDETFLRFNPSSAHNSLLNFLAEMGVIGFLLYLCFFILFRSFWRRNRIFSPVIADISYFSYLVVFIASFSEDRLTTPSSMIIVSIFMGLFISKIRFYNEKAIVRVQNV